MLRQGLSKPSWIAAMSDLSEDGYRKLLLLTRLFQEELGMADLSFPASRSTDMGFQSEHKLKHKKESNPLHHIFTPKVVSEPDPATGHYNPFPAYSYTGSVRPVYPLSPRRSVPESIRLPDHAKDGIPRAEQNFVGRNKITVLDKAQQDAMRKVCRLAREVLDIAAREVKPGVTTDHIDEVVHKACMERNVSLRLYCCGISFC